METRLTDRIAIVSGGAKGIGAAIVRQLAAEGAKVALVDRDDSAGSRLADELNGAGFNVRFVQADLTLSDVCERVVDEVRGLWSGIDILVNNAGFNDGLGLEASPEAFLQSVSASLLHVYALTHYCLPELRASRGTVINISSKVAVTGQGHTSGYAAAKGAINALTREWAAGLSADGIRVNCVIPAECHTDQYERFFQETPDPEATRAAIGHLVPLDHRLTTPEEVANLVTFLASPLASHMTGQLMFVDGGYTHLDRSLSHSHQKWS